DGSGEIAMVAALDRYIDQTMSVRGGRPRIAGTRITIDDLVVMHVHLGESLEEIAATYRVPLAAIYTALAYYFEHKAEVDRKIAEDDAFVEAARGNNPSKLQAKLRILRGE